MSEENIQIHERVKGLEVNVNTIMTNHLPHIEKAVEKNSDRLWWVLGTVILGFILTITTILLKKYL